MSDVERVQIVNGVEQLQHQVAHNALGVAELVGRHNRIVQITALHIPNNQSINQYQPTNLTNIIIIVASGL